MFYVLPFCVCAEWGGCLNFDCLKMKSKEHSILIIKEGTHL